MTERLSLRDFQQNLSSRLTMAQQRESAISLLGVESGDDTLPGGRHWLLDLTDSGEVVPLPDLAPAPLTQSWFVGMVNIRGTLYGVTDFSAWRGGEPTARNSQARLLLIGARHGNNCALLVQRVLGLRSREHLTADDAAAPLPDSSLDNDWLGGRFNDGQGMLWTQLRIPALLKNAGFLNILR